MHPPEKRFSQASVLGPCHLDLGGAVMKRWFFFVVVLFLTLFSFATHNASAQFAVRATTEFVNTETATVQHTIGESYYHDLPAVMGADIRLAESLLQLQPGYVPMQPNGDAVFRGSQFTSRMNGGQTLATENWFDGAAF